MLVSIITPSYNSYPHIIETIESVINQSYKDWEMIIVDDCSNDKSTYIIEQYAKKERRIKFFRLVRQSGVAKARNKGVALAKGSYLAFLDSDDLWDSQKLDYQLNFMTQNNLNITHTAYRQIDSNGSTIIQKVKVSDRVDYKKLLKYNEMGCLTVMYNSKEIGKHYFPEIGHEDYAKWLNILKNGNQSYGLNQVLASYRIGTGSLSSNKIKAACYTWKILRIQENTSFFYILYNFTIYIFKNIIKYSGKYFLKKSKFGFNKF